MADKLHTTRFRKPYPPALLQPGEAVIVDLSPHWAMLFKPMLAAVAALALAVGLAVVADFGPIVAAPVAVALAAVGIGQLHRAHTYFVVTSDRLVFRSGILAKRGIEIPLERLNTVFFAQSVFERILRCGDLTIESAGELGRQQFANIPHPSAVQNAIYGAIEANSSRMFGARPNASVADELTRLAELHDKGVLTDDEYAAAKAKTIGS